MVCTAEAKIDFREHNINAIFAGEAAADAGDLHYEFPALRMNNFSSHAVVYGTQNNIFFRNSPLNCLSKTYFTLGQLMALSIIKIGRGPECLNDIIVLKLFEQDLSGLLPAGCFQEFGNNINQIGNSDYDVLLDFNIVPVKDNAVTKRRFIITRTLTEPASGIQEFKNGLLSIAPTILNPSNYSVMKDLFVISTVPTDIQSILKLLVIKRKVAEGSNEKRLIDGALCNYQIFLTQADNGEIKDRFGRVLALRNVLFYPTGFHRIPTYAMPKLIDVNFDKEIELPKISTCTLSVTLSVINMEKALKISISFGDAFGNI